MTPNYKILADDTDITQIIREHLVSLRIRDARGHDSDTLEITLDDSEGNVKLPRRGVKLDVYLGYVGKTLHYKGKFTVGDISHQGPPDIISIHASAADMLEQLKAPKTRSWHQKTLGEIVTTISSEHQLKTAIAEKYKALPTGHIDQTEESDLNLLTRLAKQNDAIAKPAAGYLLFTEKGSSKSASGAALPTLTINRNEADSHNFEQNGRDEYTGTVAYWQDKNKGTRTGEHVGDKKTEKRIKGTFANAEEARRAATTEYNRLGRDSSTFEITLALGKPEITAEITIKPSGWREYIDVPWIVTEASHSLDDRGLSTNISMEKPNV